MRRTGVVHRYTTYLFLIFAVYCNQAGLRADKPTVDNIDFRKLIAPILQQHCVGCHSPENKQGNLSLTTFNDLKANDFVVPGSPSTSHLIDLVSSQDGVKPEMPKKGPALSEGDLRLLSRWITQGARWPSNAIIPSPPKSQKTWWAYQPLRTTSPTDRDARLPVSNHHPGDTQAAAQVIDYWIKAKLNENGLSMSPRADRQTLIRRLAFDLHGLPPTPEAVESFVRDSNPDAYRHLIDRMLNSPRYGERFARHWLDLAHYADTHGFERDKRRDNAWRYRDYVIDSFNEDKPYDRFIQEQIAGDVLWSTNEQATIATGFLAAGPWDFVGQVETKSPELRRSTRSLDLDDMATQVMTATMAMTVNCARCHDHKLDPIAQREYYQLRAVFGKVKREDRVINDTTLQEYQKIHEALIAQLNKIDHALGRLEGKGLNLADVVGGGNGFGTGNYRDGIDARNAKVQTRDFGKLGNVVTNKFSPSAFEFIDGVFIPDGQNGAAVIPVSSTGITITGIPTTSGNAWDMIRNGPVASQHSPELDGIDFTKKGHAFLGLHANSGITFDLAAIRLASGDDQLRFDAELGYFGADDGSYADAWIFLDGENVFEFKRLKRSDGLQKLKVEIPAKTRFLTLVSTDGGNGFGMDQIGFGDPQLKSPQVTELTKVDFDRLTKLRDDRKQVQARLQTLGSPPRFYGLVADNKLPAVQLLERGDPESPSGKPLNPGAFSVLTMLNPNLGTTESPEGDRRAALAKWITSTNNPLTPRVIANRLWQWHFGRGIVDTPSDFGSGGGTPSHPELLDWLATQLAHHQWSLKAMHRMILLSNTYQQQSNHQPNHPAMNVDADNRLLWKQTSRRIEAEAIRDSVLFVSGKLNNQLGGPGFEDFNYQDAYAPIYTYITADKPELWRRSIYRYIVRTTPDRFLTTLDCPDPANLTAQRQTTTTPLQSLALYNNEFVLKQAGYFADRLKQESGPHKEAQVHRAFKLAFGRSATDEETRLAMDLVNRQGVFSLCRALLNSNEFVYVD
ncbi:MAG: DUF1553 domain-containing protein [Rubripirellula sp.]|nr:DUF1553 domain-containing protein [Rubripirellula sp.]